MQPPWLRRSSPGGGRIDLLVNNAGVTNYNTPVWATTMEEWDEVMNTNLRGMHAVCRAVAPHMMERKQGVIINIGSSVVGQPSAYYGAYPASKWGVVGYTISLAHSLRVHGIKVNGINPGGVDTDMGTYCASRRRPEMDERGAGGASGPVPGGPRPRRDDGTVPRSLRRLIVYAAAPLNRGCYHSPRRVQA